mmetsp:Transcript_39339/g.73405  ORF Transcript_39339/g.73405 Transcript_39339/m.73405 type:complete len:260 (-) Transcript_39339:82-861(-)
MVLVTTWRLRAVQNHSERWLRHMLEYPSESSATGGSRSSRPVLHRQAASLGAPAEESALGATLKGRGRFSPEMYTNRFLQIFLFVISYVFSRTVVEFTGWQKHFEVTLLLAAGFVILYLLLLYLLPSYVPAFLQLMALPPFLDDDNLRVFISVLDDDFASRYVAEHAGRLENPLAPILCTHRTESMSSKASSRTGLTARKKDDGLIAVSELVSILETCDDVRDLRKLRNLLELQLPDDIALPQSSTPLGPSIPVGSITL